MIDAQSTQKLWPQGRHTGTTSVEKDRQHTGQDSFCSMITELTLAPDQAQCNAAQRQQTETGEDGLLVAPLCALWSQIRGQ